MSPRASGALANFITFLPAILILAALWPVASPIEGRGDTFQFWYAGRLAATGASPYAQSEWQAAGTAYGDIAGTVRDRCGEDPNAPSCVWVYPPMTAWLFAPFGALPPEMGLPLLNAFVVLSALVGIVACVWTFGPEGPVTRACLLAAAVASHPFTVDVRDGQFVGVLLVGLVALALGLRGTRTVPVVAAALAFALKPHVALVTAAASLVTLIRARRRRTVVVTAVALAAVSGVALARYPDFVGAILERGGGKTELAWATTWAFAAATGAAWIAIPIVALALAAALAALRRLPIALRAAGITAVSGAASLVIAPYAHPYDMLLAFPLLVLATTAAPRGKRRWVLLAGIAIFVLGPWAAVLDGAANPVGYSAYGLLPTALLVLNAFAASGPSPQTTQA